MKRLVITMLLASTAQAQNPIAWTLSGAPGKIGKGTARLQAEIKPGWHLYGLAQVGGGPESTNIWAPEGQPFRISGKIKSPNPLYRFDPNFNVEVSYFEKEVLFQVPIELISRPAEPLVLKVYYQSCNDKVCLRPRTVTVQAAK